MADTQKINYYKEHQNRLKQLFKAAAKEFPQIIMIPYDVGMARDFDTVERVIRYGQKGVPDSIVFAPGGRALFLDMKTGKSGLSPEQRNFKKRADWIFGYVAVKKVKSVEQGLEIIREFLNEDAQ